MLVYVSRHSAIQLGPNTNQQRATRYHSHRRYPRSAPASTHPPLGCFPTSIFRLQMCYASLVIERHLPMVVSDIHGPMLDASSPSPTGTCNVSCALANQSFGTQHHNTDVYVRLCIQRESSSVQTTTSLQLPQVCLPSLPQGDVPRLQFAQAGRNTED